MTKTLRLFFPVALAIVALAHSAFAQYGGQGLGSALSSDPLSHQGQVRPGVDDIASRASQETPFKIIKDVELGLKDADPNVRVSELTKLRDLHDPEVNQILIQSMADQDLRVKLKAIDILGAREANAAVPAMSSMLFLRSTEQIVKLHLVSELGRIGDAQGTLPIMQFMAEPRDERGRGTAVFALGEIESDKAVPLLNRVLTDDQSPMVRRLAREALLKIDGQLPFEHQKQLASQQDPHAQVPTDQKLAKLRELDQKSQDQER
ncbi:HEAT repeat domain-containing protein [Candidatus Binatus sp.]|uniref:HEAT repeat domain-containing protein n=1 Tax=Candidatus Binatus sp. TaxID=2811406 RepID=UPI003BB2104E